MTDEKAKEAVEKKPFSRDFMLKLTARYMRKSIKFSIYKTVQRIKEFEGDGAKSMEILATLNDLHRMLDFVNQIIKGDSK